MSASAWLLVLLAPLVRDPVGLGAWQDDPDPFRRRLASLMVAEPATDGFVTVVPITARVPSEAGAGQGDLPGWYGSGLHAVEVGGQERPYVRVVNPAERPVLVPAGTTFRSGRREVALERDAIVPADFGVLCPVRVLGPSPDAARATLWPEALLAPLPAGLLLDPGADETGAVVGTWRAAERAETWGQCGAGADFDRRLRRLDRAVREALEPLGGTEVGAVFLVGGEIVGAHVFASRELFRAALPQLLSSVALQESAAERATGGKGGAAWRALRQRTGWTDARRGALAWLRALRDAEGSWAESWGEGFDLVLHSKAERSRGHAVLDHRHRLVHAGLFHLGAWMERADGRARPPAPARPPAAAGSETPPGQVDRKARPSIAEARRRDRRPGPPGTGTRPR